MTVSFMELVEFSAHGRVKKMSLTQACRLGLYRPRFKSGQPHHLLGSELIWVWGRASPILFIPFSVELKLFTELNVENCFIKRFKWFSNVLLRLKPSSLDYSTRSLSKYNTTLPFVVNAFAFEGLRGEFPCYKCDHFRNN
jgi:hypothetical protein